MLSYWEKKSLTHYDTIIIGSGIVGLQAAINHKNKYPKLTVAILERGLLPTGASTRNAGFACFGSAAELIDDLKANYPIDVAKLYHKRKEGIRLLRAQLGDAAIGYKQEGGIELLKPHETNVLDQLNELNDLLGDEHNHKTFEVAHHIIKEQGINTNTFPYAVRSQCEGSIDTGKLMQSLVGNALLSGIHIITGANVANYQEHGENVTVNVWDELRKTNIEFSCGNLILCTNAFTNILYDSANLKPGRGQVLITQPIHNLKLKGVYHFEQGYYYFRIIDNRILFGGGRNLAFDEETTTELALNHSILNNLKTILTNDIIPDTHFEIAMQWSGIMAFGPTKDPIVQQIGTRVYGAFRLGGMGVALGTQVAKELINLL